MVLIKSLNKISGLYIGSAVTEDCFC